MDPCHVALPDDRRQAAAGDIVHRRVVIIADPDPGREIGRIADIPGVAEGLAGAGLAGRGAAGEGGAAPGSGQHHILQHGRHGLRHGGGGGPLRRSGFVFVKHIAA